MQYSKNFEKEHEGLRHVIRIGTLANGTVVRCFSFISSSNTTMPFSELTDEIIIRILTFIEISDILSLRQVRCPSLTPYHTVVTND